MRTGKSQVEVSVIIPVYNDPEGLKTTLNSVTDQTYPRENYEVLVVDNNSTDETYTVASEYAQKTETVTVFVEDEIQSSYAARNRGIQNANGDILAFIDADMSVETDWLENATTVMANPNIQYMGTSVCVYSSTKHPNLSERYQIAKGFPVQSYLHRDNFSPTCCLFVEKSVIDEVGNFDSTLISGGDLEFGNRVYNQGIKLHYTPEIIVYHPTRPSFSDLLKKQRRIGFGKAQLYKNKSELVDSLFHPRHFLPTTPVHFIKQLNPNYDVTYWEVVIFYLLSYILKLRRSVAMVSSYYTEVKSN